MPQNHIYQADLVLKIGICVIFESYFVRKDTVLTIRGLDTLTLLLKTMLLYLREARKHTSSNGCMSSQHNFTLPGLAKCPKLVI